jgi:hypothetical protein
MNERIQELKEQAMEWVPNRVDPDTKIRLLNSEKFAELIVRECAAVVFRKTGPKSALDVLEHFGVEE